MEKSCDNCKFMKLPLALYPCSDCSGEFNEWVPGENINLKVIPTKLMHTTDPIFLPYRKHPNDAGADLRARIEQPIRLHPGELHKVPSGVAVEIPPGYVGLLQPRSGASGEGKLTITGIIDSSYRGEMSMNVFNPLDSNYVVINPKERIAQLVIVPYLQTEFVQVDELGESDRGTDGFGSTGSM